MPLRLARIDLDHDSDDLIDFLSTEVFPFHVVEKPTRTQAKARIESGTFASPDNLAYWIVYANEKVGYINFHDMTDNAPMFDLRLAERTRGNGYGEEALRAGTTIVFSDYPLINRIEGNTRSDNIAMQKVFLRCGYVKEAHYRQGWSVEGEDPKDSVAYAIIRSDWKSGKVTPVQWGV